jgi:hypothetical protein
MRKLVCEKYSRRTRTQNTIARKGTRIGEQDQSSLDRTTRRGHNSQTGQPRSQNRTTRKGQGMGQVEGDKGQQKQRRQSRTVRIEHPEHESRNKTARKGLSGQALLGIRKFSGPDVEN